MKTKLHSGQKRLLSLLAPIGLFLLSLALLLQLPRENYFFPRPLNYRSHYENFYNHDLPYVSVTVPELSYTGLDYHINGETSGNYYYTLYDGFCQFYLLEGDDSHPAEPVLEDVSLKGRLIQLEEEEYHQLLTLMAEELSWSYASLKERTAPYAVSTRPHPIVFRWVEQMVLCGCLLFSLGDVLHILRQHLTRRKKIR